MQRTNYLHLYMIFMVALIWLKDTTASSLILATDDGPPHMIKATNSGIDIDIVRQVLNQIGYDIDTVYVSLKRAKRMVIENKADVFVPTFFQDDSDKIYLSHPVIRYRPMVFTLKSRNISYHAISDLKHLSIATFQGASGYFGEEFSSLSKKSDYRELPDMAKLPELLLKGRFDVIILDFYIFYYFLKKQLENNPAPFAYREISSFALVPEVNAYAGFNNKTLRDKFNQQLSIFKGDKLDQEIIEYYIGPIEILADED